MSPDIKVYLDTSVLVPYYFPEKYSDVIENYLLTVNLPVISNLTELEFASALAKKIRNKELTQTDANKILSQFQSHVINGYFIKIDIKKEHFDLARDWIQQFKVPLRSLDAFHLAAAVIDCQLLVTSDLNLKKSAEFFGIKVKYFE